MRAYLEVIKRLFIPDYEVARLYFRDAISEGYFEPNTKENYHHTLDIQPVFPDSRN